MPLPSDSIYRQQMISTWQGHPNFHGRGRVLFRGHLTRQACLCAVRPSFCSTRFVQFARRCSSGTSQVNWSTDGVRYIIFSAACIYTALCPATCCASCKRKIISVVPCKSIAPQYLSPFSGDKCFFFCTSTCRHFYSILINIGGLQYIHHKNIILQPSIFFFFFLQFLISNFHSNW